MRRYFLETNAYNMIAFIWDNKMIVFDCDTIEEAREMNYEQIYGETDIEKVANLCSTEIYDFNEDDYEKITPLDRFYMHEPGEADGYNYKQTYSLSEIQDKFYIFPKDQSREDFLGTDKEWEDYLDEIRELDDELMEAEEIEDVAKVIDKILMFEGLATGRYVFENTDKLIYEK